MPLLKHKGGSLAAYDSSGNRVILHYGPGLHKPCPECRVKKNELCITASGRLLNKSHSARLK